MFEFRSLNKKELKNTLWLLPNRRTCADYCNNHSNHKWRGHIAALSRFWNPTGEMWHGSLWEWKTFPDRCPVLLPGQGLHSFVFCSPWSDHSPLPVNGNGTLTFPLTSLATSKSGHWRICPIQWLSIFFSLFADQELESPRIILNLSRKMFVIHVQHHLLRMWRGIISL